MIKGGRERGSESARERRSVAETGKIENVLNWCNDFGKTMSQILGDRSASFHRLFGHFLTVWFTGAQMKNVCASEVNE